VRYKAHMGEVRNACRAERLKYYSCPVKRLRTYEVQHKNNETDSISRVPTVGGEK